MFLQIILFKNVLASQNELKLSAQCEETAAVSLSPKHLVLCGNTYV